MKKSRQVLETILGLLLGFFLGLTTTWWIAPIEKFDFSPAALRDDFKDEYRLLVATTYTITSDLGRAKIRLMLLKDENVVQSLIEQAIRLQTGLIRSSLFPDSPEENVYALALLANAIEQSQTGQESTATWTKILAESNPTVTPKPYELISQEIQCDGESSTSLARIIVMNGAGKQQPGVEILVIWEQGQESIFTGLKPNMGIGYADFIMEPDVLYTIQIMPSSLPVGNLSAPDCTLEDGTIYKGDYLLQFQQP